MVEVAIEQDKLKVRRSEDYKEWTKEDVLLEIKELYKTEVHFNSKYMLENHPVLFFAARRYFKNWAKAVKEAGLDYSKIRLIRRNPKVDFYLRQDFENYLRYQRQISENTTKIYLSLIIRFQKFLWQNTDTKKEFNNVTPQDISDFLHFLQGKNSASTIGLYINALRCYYKFAYYFCKIESLGQLDSFLNNIVKTKKNHSIAAIPEREEVSRLRLVLSQQLELNSWNKHSFQYKNTLRDFVMIELLITSGMRASELNNLECKDIDLEKKTIFIKKGKGGYPRMSIFGESVLSLLKEYLEIYKFAPNDKLFSRHGNFIWRVVRDWAAKAQIHKRIHPHSFRHYFITESQRQGIPVTSVATQVGHRALNTTLGYTHWDINSLVEQFKEHTI